MINKMKSADENFTFYNFPIKVACVLVRIKSHVLSHFHLPTDQLHPSTITL